MPSTRRADQRVTRARSFRKNPTDAERKLWQQLRQFPNVGVHFRRQATIGPYFADFACHTMQIVIEVDGGQHAESATDAARTAYLETQGYRVLRFWNNDVLENIDGVLEVILAALDSRPPPPTPPHRKSGGRGEERADAFSPLPPLGGEGSGVGGASHQTSKNDDLAGGHA